MAVGLLPAVPSINVANFVGAKQNERSVPVVVAADDIRWALNWHSAPTNSRDYAPASRQCPR